MEGLISWYQGLPRAMRWALLAGVLLVMYFGIYEPAALKADDLDLRADRLERLIERERDLSESDDSALARAFGLPDAVVDSRVALDERVAEVLSSHGVRDRRIEGAPTPLRLTQAQRLAGIGGTLERLVLTVTFEASPEVATSVIADLERAPEVAALERIELRAVEGSASSGAGARTVRATIGVETWLKSGGAR